MKNKLGFLVVGAAKSGTTSLFSDLVKHDDIFIPNIKECRFFSQLSRDFKGLGAEYFINSGIRNIEEFSKLFIDHNNKICGDISNDYLYYYKNSIHNIKKYLDKDVKIIIILRNPVDRAYSNYMHCIRDGVENLNFENALKAEEKRIEEHWAWPYHYKNVGLYYRQVEAYLSNFKNVKIYLFEEMHKQDIFLKDIFNFLNVTPIKVKNSIKNRSGIPKSKIIHKFFYKSNPIKKICLPIIKSIITQKGIDFIFANANKYFLKRVSMEAKTREYLLKYYREDVKSLSKLINRDLTHWLK